MKKDPLSSMRDGTPLSRKEQLGLIWQLSLPAIMAQITSVILSYADASMVGRLGAGASASIGLVSSTTWLIGGLCMAAASGYTVQVAHATGGKNYFQARILVRHGILVALGIGLALMAIGLAISGPLPAWLGGEESIRADSTAYFAILAMGLPLQIMNYVAGGMLQCSGEMKVPAVLNSLTCLWNLLLNALMIFPSGTFRFFGWNIPGAGLGVRGAAIATIASEGLGGILMLYFLLVRSGLLHLRKGEHAPFTLEELKKCARISIPQAFESVITGSAYVAFTAIVAPLGTISIAANSFSITAESLCYMPGYGIGIAATTLIGQSYGAGRKDLTRQFSRILTGLGTAVMAVMGALMYFFAPQMIALLSPDTQVRALGTAVLRIEAFAEPMYGASIVAGGILKGLGDTLSSSLLSLLCMWCIRIPLAALLSRSLGLRGAWIAMCIELCARGILFLVRLKKTV